MTREKREGVPGEAGDEVERWKCGGNGLCDACDGYEKTSHATCELFVLSHPTPLWKYGTHIENSQCRNK